MNFNQASYTISAKSLKDCPDDSAAEVAFAGRSNAGKSSAINAITGQSRLARISKTPGRTQSINYFRIEDGRYLVDLPGYGFAKVPLEVKQQWQYELERYLRQRRVLVGLILLSDIRHPLKDFDRMMIDWAQQSELPLLLLLTKADKLKRGAVNNALTQVQGQYADGGLTVQPFSALRSSGVEQVRSVLSQWLQAPPELATQPS